MGASRAATVLRAEHTVLRPKAASDLHNDYAWRMDPVLCRLDAAMLVDMSLEEYRKHHAAELRRPSPWSIRFAVDTAGGQHIGNATVYNIDLAALSAEYGIMIGSSRHWGMGHGRVAGELIMRHIFTNSDLRLVYLHTLVSNRRAAACFTAGGFEPLRVVSRNGQSFHFMQLDRERWENHSASYNEG